ncbi:hypothetical protein CLOP_g10122 [Closterium sp. NIES-67]|nr:hypothetical protein CLOP_g10122 [Closterium sp. NIES-67]
MLSEVTVELRTTYRATLQGVVEKLYENTQLGRTTSLKRVLKEVRPQAGDDMTSKLQPLSALIGSLLAQADAVLSSRVFMGTARGLWDRHGREVLHFLEKRREGVSWFKSASAAITLDTLDNLFAQQMQRLQGHASWKGIWSRHAPSVTRAGCCRRGARLLPLPGCTTRCLSTNLEAPHCHLEPSVMRAGCCLRGAPPPRLQGCTTRYLY